MSVAVACALSVMVPNAALWKKIPPSDPANRILELVRAAQPKPSDLPEGSTYNYIWAQNMMAWMMADRSGLMASEEANRRIVGLLRRVADWETFHGFFYDAYDPATGKPTSENVYFQGWWLWALILARAAYPEAAPLADKILKRLDYDAAGMINEDHTRLAADRNARTGKVTFYIDPTGDISGELRTPLIAYTWLTGDAKPWRTTAPNRLIEVGGRSMLAVWHGFTFDPFYVHSCFPEVGYFQKSFDELVAGAEAHRKANGMEFYATRMDPLEAWTEDPERWPNTEHRVAKPWTAWLVRPDAPVMERAWVPGYGVVQTFDRWNFRWGHGEPSAAFHPNPIGPGRFKAAFELEVLPESLHPPHPPRLTSLSLRAVPDPTHPPTGPLIVAVNGTEVGRLEPGAPVAPLVPTSPLLLKAKNEVTLTTSGPGSWRVYRTPQTFRSVEWSDASPSAKVDAFEMEVTVDGQRWDRENPYAFLCRAAGAYGNFPWKLLLEKDPMGFGDRLVAWVGAYSKEVSLAHRIYNTDSAPVKTVYTLSPWERAATWKLEDADDPAHSIEMERKGETLTWTQPARTLVTLKKR